MSKITQEQVLESLKQIIDPDLLKDIVTLGFIRDLQVSGGDVSFTIMLTTPACPVKEQMESEATRIVSGLDGVDNVKVKMDAEVPQGRGIANNVAIPGVKNIIAVSSGKGGVGKSTVAVNMAIALAMNGAKVGIMDADVYGPNVPMMLGSGYDQPEVENGKLRPIVAHGIKMISMAVLVPRDKPMILRGPMLHGVVRQFLSDVNWGELDYLIVDMPPGTGDIQLSLAQLVPVQGAVLVTTPQDVSISDVRRAVKMFETVNVPVLGVIENMSYFIAPDTGNKYEIFGKGGGQKICDEYGLNLLGEVPLGMEVREGGDSGVPVVVSFPDSPQAAAFRKVAEEVARQVSIEAMKPELVIMSRAQ
ncbi:MAG TPA: Mrp/NBP35 family ATP-binding protein [Pyrinomonadaceae bacterium]|nr:Mrp/NBP35 family ATP-binding protein [Chloracidobacterium sp.]MBP9934662.1 Mrp/NBP35 family ATP-binding protein [Pyrinomonadaceae bacterium]MBK7804632.1 Mrp/NBP35 family ATP-binding protein [Chloracidobacterium sp.]MBK9439042.1 Mrp/NBP35 family ATP-binding protein [Chloracidobacterium sp.]MBL0240552.1 Mrp/NBP35 family ATP-binding protein [Chloracidobacterium sp.]